MSGFGCKTRVPTMTDSPAQHSRLLGLCNAPGVYFLLIKP